MKAMCDLGESINIMILSVFNTLRLGKPRSSNVILYFADRSRVDLEGIIEDVLIKVGNIVIPIKFIILEYEENDKFKLYWDILFRHQ